MLNTHERHIYWMQIESWLLWTNFIRHFHCKLERKEFFSRFPFSLELLDHEVSVCLSHPHWSYTPILFSSSKYFPFHAIDCNTKTFQLHSSCENQHKRNLHKAKFIWFMIAYDAKFWRVWVTWNSGRADLNSSIPCWMFMHQKLWVERSYIHLVLLVEQTKIGGRGWLQQSWN